MKTAWIILSFFLFCHFTVLSQDLIVDLESKIYKQVDGMDLQAHLFYTTVTRENPENPAIAFFHGGGWVFGSPEEFFGACKRYAGKGFITISFQYRLSINEDGSYPHPGITPVESVKDARSAIRWLRENAKELKIDPDRIVVGGQSAGGQLALSTALAETVNEKTDDLSVSPVPNALVLYSSCVNTMEAWVDMILGERRKEIWSISPYHNLRPDMPPVIAFHGEDDCTVLMYTIQLFSERMLELGNRYELITFPGRRHYLGEGNEKYARYFDEEIMERTDQFLSELGLME
jgi:acetyl esterase